MNLQQIQEACLETLHYGVVHAILSAKNEWRSWLLEHGSIGNRQHINQLLKTRKQEWAIVQRDPKGMFLLDAQIKDHMRSRGIVPDRWLLAPRTAMYFSMVSDFQTEFYRRGPQSQVNLQQGGEAMNPFRGTQVREVRKFDMDFCNKPSCPLSRPRSIGSYYTMETADEEITLYDMDKDCWVTLKKEEICETAGIEKAHPADARLLIMRFAETYQMGSGVLVKSGEEFGSTFVGNSDMMLSDNALSKTHIGHFTYYSKTVIRRPELAYIAEDIFAEDYIVGEGTKVYNADFLEDDLTNGRIGTPDQKADMVAVWIDAKTHVCNPLDVRGSFDPDMTGTSDRCFTAMGEQSAKIIKLLKDHLSTATNIEEEDAFRVPFARCNVYCYKGAHACKRAVGAKCVMHPNTGFWGPDVYSGCREARTGNLVQLQPQKRGCTDSFCCPPSEPVLGANGKPGAATAQEHAPSATQTPGAFTTMQFDAFTSEANVNKWKTYVAAFNDDSTVSQRCTRTEYNRAQADVKKAETWITKEPVDQQNVLNLRLGRVTEQIAAISGAVEMDADFKPEPPDVGAEGPDQSSLTSTPGAGAPFRAAPRRKRK